VGPPSWDEEGVPIRTEIHVIRRARAGKPRFYLYAMLRTGKRNGKIRTLDLRDPSDLKEVVLTDEPIRYPGGTLQAQLVIGPRLNIEKSASE
jgi:hypothetical protein